MYSNKVIEHFMTPRNGGTMTNADGKGVYGDPGCGDSLTIYIKVKDNIIEDISFLVFGCTASVATSSMTTVLAKGEFFMSTLPKEVLREMINNGNLKTAGDLHSYLKDMFKDGAVLPVST